MGYTHYWRRPKEHAVKDWKVFLADVKTVIRSLPKHSSSSGACYPNEPLRLAGGNGSGKPEFSEELINFNGFEGKSDMSHETVYIPRVMEPMEYNEADEQGRFFEFCKTARKPYDLACQAVLLVYKLHFPDVKISSDGDVADWEEARALVARTLNILVSLEEGANGGFEASFERETNVGNEPPVVI